MLTQIFSEDSRFSRLMNRLGDLILLNLLWLLTSLPLFTIGASTTALFSVLFRAVKNEESYLARSFFRKLKENFRQATCLWLITAAILAVMLSDLYIMGRMSGVLHSSLSGLVTGVATGMLIFTVLTLIYLFPMQARYENTVWQTLYKSFLFSLRHFGYTFQMIGVILMPLALFMMLGLATGTGLSWACCFYVLVGVSSTAYFLVKGPWKLLIQRLEPESLERGEEDF